MRLAAACLTALLLSPAPALAACGKEALGTARVLTVDAKNGPRFGTKQYPQTLPLADREVVLTFDDGPNPGTTDKVLAALAAECVKATFFLVGRIAEQHPALAKRIVAEGHTLAYHSDTHPMTLATIPYDRAIADIEKGFAVTDKAAYGRYSGNPVVPFFRFPGFADSPALQAYLAKRGIAIFGADFWASDWNVMTPETQLNLVLSRLEQARRGIILFHDTKSQTAAMVPPLLKALKARGYRVVHIVPKPN